MNEFENRNDVYSEKSNLKKNNRRFDIIALVLCLIAAIGIWIYVTNSSQAVSEKTIIIAVNAEEQVRNDTGMSIIGGNDQFDYSQILVELTVTGTEYALERYDDEEYHVELDTSDVEKAGKYNFSFKYTLPGSDISFKSISPSYISTPVLVDTLETRDVELVAEYSEGGLSSGTLGGLTPRDRETISVSGPKSIVGNISRAIVYVNLAGYEKSTDVKSKTFEFVDNTGAVLNNDYNYIRVEPSEIDVHIQINYTDKNVPITVKYTATDTDTYRYSVTILKEDNTDPMIPLTGDSALFPESLVYDLGDITETSGREITIGELIESEGLIPEGLATGAEKSLKLIIKVTKTRIDSDLSGQSENG